MILGLGACSQTAGVADTLSGGGTDQPADDGMQDGTTGGSVTTTGVSQTGMDLVDSSSGGNDTGVFDVAPEDTGGPQPICTVGRDIDGIGACDAPPLSESFNAEVQWSWAGDGTASSYVTPLVANLNDDNEDGAVDLCDTPDIIAVITSDSGPYGASELVALDGDSAEGGTVHWTAAEPISTIFNPALGDIDGDGLVEIVAVQAGVLANTFHLIAFSNDGEVEWISPDHDGLMSFGHVALADLDADGDVEIMAGGIIADHEGNAIVSIPELEDRIVSGVAVDLDGDGDLEYVHPLGAHHHDGAEYFAHDGIDLEFPQIADIDDDGDPEILYSAWDGPGLTIYEHDGNMKSETLVPSLVGLPAALHDMNGDGAVDMAVGNGSYGEANYGVLEFDGDSVTSLWSTTVQGGCCAGGTAFDFLGDATAEAMFGDDFQLYIFGETGNILTSAPRRSPTGTDYPVVADVDNDGSAEIIVVAAEPARAPAIQVIRDAAEGWVQARRIWNQHSYHVTNVREDGTIPQHQPSNWLDLNTFRTQAQIGTDGVCVPAG